MRKLIVLIVSVVLSIGILSACGGVDENKLIRGSVSDMTENVLFGSDDNFELEVVSGYREAPYALDGVCNATARFFMLKATPKTECTADSIEYSFTAGGETYSGVMARSRYRNSYNIDLKKDINCGNELTVTLKNGETSGEIAAATVISDKMVTASGALDKAMEKYKDKLGAMIENKDFKGEIAVRLINDKGQTEKKYFWYVAVIKGKSDINSILIDAATGEIVAERN